MLPVFLRKLRQIALCFGCIRMSVMHGMVASGKVMRQRAFRRLRLPHGVQARRQNNRNGQDEDQKNS